MEPAASFFDEPRTFRAKTPQGALAAVKAALGPDAIIMSCEEVGKSLFKPATIEVVARAPHALDPSALAAPLPARRDDDDDTAEAHREDDETATPLSVARASRAFGFAPQNGPKGPTKRRSIPGTNRRSIPRTPSHDGVPGPVDIDPESILIDLGIDPLLARELSVDMGPRDDQRGVLQSARRMLKNQVTLSRPPWTPDPTNERSVIALLGPTGAGKTTTAAKIAARAMMERGLKVVLITLDHYRVGAADQLLRYGDLMGVQVIPAADPKSFTRALDNCLDADLVLVDTAGRSPHDHQTIAQQAATLRLCPDVERVLVVPATTSGRQLGRVHERFLPMGLDRMIVTKVDESEGPASVLSVAARLEIPLAAMGDGQSVTDDLRRVTWDWLLSDFSAAVSA